MSKDLIYKLLLTAETGVSPELIDEVVKYILKLEAEVKKLREEKTADQWYPIRDKDYYGKSSN